MLRDFPQEEESAARRQIVSISQFKTVAEQLAFEINCRLSAATLRKSFLEARPFPHLVLDGLISGDILDAIAGEFDLLRDGERLHHDNVLQRKIGSKPNIDLPAITQQYFNFVYSGPFLRFISGVTGIDDLIPDPSLFGGGMHEITQGGCFQVHTDFRRHPRTRLDNRLVMITYLNHDWQESFGGALELWRQDPPGCEACILPKFGRTVIMLQSERSVHGLPRPVAAPDGRGRRSVAAYYYTNGRDDGDAGTARDEPLITNYFYHGGMSRRQKFAFFIRRTIPPVAVRALTAMRRRVRA